MVQQVIFPSGTVLFDFQGGFETLRDAWDAAHVVIVTNEHISKLYSRLFRGLRVLVLPACESSKDIHTIGTLTRQLLDMKADRKTLLVGVGGGVITDITGFLASVYMRGIRFGFAPTTLLAMADAAIGGKNGVNSGMYKNILGTITQPEFICYDYRFLNTLPDDEWSNGFAEIIKYGCIFDAGLLEELQQHSISFYQDEDDAALQALVKRCAEWKIKTVQEDEKETGSRKLLNFGHTAAHAIENLYELPHGKAVGIGMLIACMISEQVSGLDHQFTEQLRSLLSRYHLPVSIKFDAHKAMEVLRMDKKRVDDMIDYVVLERAGKAQVRTLPFDTIEQALITYESNH